jgi:hypothetical protein
LHGAASTAIFNAAPLHVGLISGLQGWGLSYPDGGVAGGDGDVDDGFPGGRVDDLAGRLRLNEEAGD